MARIIESGNNSRRIIKLSTSDVISIVQEYQTLVSVESRYEDIRSILEDKAIFVPEDI